MSARVKPGNEVTAMARWWLKNPSTLLVSYLQVCAKRKLIISSMLTELFNPRSLTLSHPVMPYGVMVLHKLMGIYMGFLIPGVIL